MSYARIAIDWIVTYRCRRHNNSPARRSFFRFAVVGDTPTFVQRQKHGEKEHIINIPIQNKVKPGISQNRAHIQVPRGNGHDPGLVTNREQDGDKRLNS